MNNKHLKTLKEVFYTPTPKNIEWRRIEALLIALNCELIEGNGSRVAFILLGKRADFHRPHPYKEAKPYQVKAVAEFLILIGVENEHDDA